MPGNLGGNLLGSVAHCEYFTIEERMSVRLVYSGAVCYERRVLWALIVGAVGVVVICLGITLGVVETIDQVGVGHGSSQ